MHFQTLIKCCFLFVLLLVVICLVPCVVGGGSGSVQYTSPSLPDNIHQHANLVKKTSLLPIMFTQNTDTITTVK